MNRGKREEQGPAVVSRIKYELGKVLRRMENENKTKKKKPKEKKSEGKIAFDMNYRF